jgi:transketolase
VTQRDAFFGEVVKAAYDNPNIVILSADSGAPAFNQFRIDRPQQWIHMGISEANMINVAAGLAIAGKQVFCFAIIPFITGRCFDQLKVAIALRGLPVTIVGVGAGYSYDDGGPTHYGVEDIGIMKNLKGIEIWSPASDLDAASIAQMTLQKPAFRYIRLDRHILPVESHYPKSPTYPTLVLAYGAMIKQAWDAGPDVFPCTMVFPFLGIEARTHKRIVVVEEHFYTGGLGETVAAWMKDHDDQRPLLRIAIPDQYEWENGGRAHLWKRAGLDVESITKRITEWMA